LVCICFLSETEHRREFGVIGTEGRIFFSLDDNETLHIERGKGEKMTYNSTAVVRGGLFRDFVESIVHGRQPLVSAADGRASLLAPLAAERSLDEKRVVHVSELDGYQA
jgi:predicted dehydrogenase